MATDTSATTLAKFNSRTTLGGTRTAGTRTHWGYTGGGMDTAGGVLNSAGRARCWSAGRRRLQVAAHVIRQHPSTLIVPLVMLCTMLAVGLWGTMWSANVAADVNKNQAQSFAETFMSHYQLGIQQIYHPLSTIGVAIRNNPANWTALNKTLNQMVPDILNLPDAKSSQLQVVFVAPQGRVQAQYISAPFPTGYYLLQPGMPSRQAMMATLAVHGPVLGGPYEITSQNLDTNFTVSADSLRGVKLMVVTYIMPVYVSAPATALMNQTLPMDILPNTDCADYCAPYKGEIFWGFLGSTKTIQQYINGSIFEEAGLLWSISAPDRSSRSGSSSGYVDSARIIVGQSLAAVRDPVVASVTMDATNSTWILEVSPDTGTWQPVWRNPLIAVVVVFSCALATMQFFALLAWRRHGMLLASLLPENVLHELEREHDYGASGAMNAAVLAAGTPAEAMLHVLATTLQGEPPDLRDVVLVRTTLMRGADVYRPLDLTAKIKAASGMDSDVAKALARQLDNTWVPTTSVDGTEDRMTVDTNGLSVINAFHYAGREEDFASMPTALDAILFPDGGDDGGGLQQSSDACNGSGASIVKSPPRIRAESNAGTEPPLCASYGAVSVQGAAGPDAAAVPEENTSAASAAAALAPPLPVAVDQSNSIKDVVGVNCVSSGVSSPAADAGVQRLPRQLQVDELQRQLATSSEWAFDAMSLATISNGRPLSALGFYIFSTTGLIDRFKIKRTVLVRYLSEVEDLYLNNPYHSATHAADVLQTLHVLLQRGGLAGTVADPLGQLACYITAVVHDLGHLGRTNDFLCATSHDLAVRYNDKAPLENHHVSQAFELLRQPGLDFLAPLTSTQRNTLRRMVIELVLATDMKQHFSVVSQFTTLYGVGMDKSRLATESGRHSPRHRERPSISGAAVAPVPGHISCMGNTPPSPQLDDAGKLLTLQFALKCADLGHLASPLPVHLRWVAALEEEYFRQGDAEKDAGLSVSPLFDRCKPGITKSQVGFFNFVVLPQFNALAAALPAVQPLTEAVNANYCYWQEHEAKEKGVAAAAASAK